MINKMRITFSPATLNSIINTVVFKDCEIDGIMPDTTGCIFENCTFNGVHFCAKDLTSTFKQCQFLKCCFNDATGNINLNDCVFQSCRVLTAMFRMAGRNNKLNDCY